MFKDLRDRKNKIEREIRRIKTTVVKPSEQTNAHLKRIGTPSITDGVHLDQLLKRAECDYKTVIALAPAHQPIGDKEAKKVEIEIKYEGYIQRQLKEIA